MTSALRALAKAQGPAVPLSAVPHAARAYDYALGGVHHFEADRELWREVEKALPGAGLIARANRAFVGRAVRHLADQGVRQFLDLGCGLPTVGSVHEAAPQAAVVYVDIDPVVVELSQVLLAGNPRVAAVPGDLRYPAATLGFLFRYCRMAKTVPLR